MQREETRTRRNAKMVSVAEEVEYDEEKKDTKRVHGFGDRDGPPGCPIGAGLGGYACCGTASPEYIGYGTTPIPDMALISCHCG